MPDQTSSAFHEKPQALSRGIVLAMATTCAFSVANIYYNQPILPELARSFGVPESSAGIVPTVTQAGYAAGLIFLAPLGDRFERRRVVLVMTACLMLSLIAASLAPTLMVLSIVSFIIGMFSTLAQQVVPMAAHLAEPERRGSIVGMVMSGLLIGILGARTFAGIVADTLGWRATFLIAAAFMAAIGFMVRMTFPTAAPTSSLSYPQLIRSPWRILVEEPVIAEASCIGALLFAAFSVFWSTLALYLDSPAYRLGATVAGAFGLLGIAGAAAAPLSGKFADKGRAHTAIGLGIVCTALAFVSMGWFGAHLAGLIIGVLLLDFGVQAAQISNQSRIYAIRPEARSRITTVYIGLYFVGGSLGSAAGTIAWSMFGWMGVSAVGLVLPLIALTIHLIAARKKTRLLSDRS